ncbi:MAG: GHKL domain-containing protein [Clostridiales Family XIII bacterium]|jgi:signal transduction histidine kinase|nr:GHKL domain-containing protein [Clostridiales Family XIII bacterium]
MWASLIYTIATASILILIFYMALDLRNQPLIDADQIWTANDVTYQIQDGPLLRTTLPAQIKDLAPLSAVTVTTKIHPASDAVLRVETNYTALRLYANDALIYECGAPGTYPAFLIDPPTIISMVKLPDSGAQQELRFEYSSPRERTAMTLPDLEYGDEIAVLASQFKKHGAAFLIAILLLLLGGVMLIFSLYYSAKRPAAASFVRLGAFTLSIGVWSFGECPFTAFLFPFPAVLYMMSYCGLFLFALPFLRFLELTLRPHLLAAFQMIRYIMCIPILLCFLLQVTGRMSLAHNVFGYEIMVTGILVVILILTFVEFLYYNNLAARRFILPIIVIILFTLASFLNYELRFLDSLTLIFQIGALIFIMQLAFIGLRFMQDAAQALSEKKILEMRLHDMNLQIDVQRRQFERLAADTDQTKAMHHDFRHQISALKSYSESGDLIGLKKHLDALQVGLEHTEIGNYCRNYAVNSVAAYYVAVARSEGMTADVHLNIPEETGRVPAVDLCVILGNLFENAIEALRRMETEEKYISVYSKIAAGTLSIIVENNFDGIWRKEREAYISRKIGADAREGIGLSSVRAVCERYGGLIRIESDDQIWRVSTIVKM